MSQPSHSAASRISAMWKAHKAQMANKAWNDKLDEHWNAYWAGHPHYDELTDKPLSDFGPDRGIEARRIRSLPPLTPEQGGD